MPTWSYAPTDWSNRLAHDGSLARFVEHRFELEDMRFCLFRHASRWRTCEVRAKPRRLDAQKRARVLGHRPRGLDQRIGNARRELALQVAAEERDVPPGLELAEDRVMQRLVKLGELQRLLRVVHLRDVVQEPLRDRRAHQRV